MTLRSSSRKLQSLDGLRAIAIIFVFFHHLKNYIPAVNAPVYYLQRYIEQGWIGVDLFFVLSGFLITGILIDTRPATNYFSGFYARRVLRIFPLYYTVLIAIVIGAQWIAATHTLEGRIVAAVTPLPQDRWTYFCFLTNWIGLWHVQWGPRFGSILAHFWSLGVEEQFYLVWPFLVWIVRPRHLPWVAGSLALLSAITRLGWAMHIGVQALVPPVSKALHLATICRLDSLFLGALAAWLYRNPGLLARVRPWLPPIARACLIVFFAVYSALLFLPGLTLQSVYGDPQYLAHSTDDVLGLFLLFGGYTLLAIGFASCVLLTACTDSQPTRMQSFLCSRPLSAIGKYSYGIYVFHVPILGLFEIFIIPRLAFSTNSALGSLTCLVVIAALSFLIPALSYEIFERKILHLKRYFEPRFAPESHQELSLSSRAANAG